jgi:hypothetical protein
VRSKLCEREERERRKREREIKERRWVGTETGEGTIGANHVGGHDVSQEGTSRDGPGELDVVTRADGVDLGVDSVAQVDIGWVVQEGGGNVGTRGQVSGENAAGENMVLKDSSHQGNLVGIDVGLLKGGVVGGKHSEGTCYSKKEISLDVPSEY